ncbi:DHA2 family efflux MFS transporter permease subunit [Streptacidiphilus sp. N1-12]|uniref:DHA2 family efflux MFS transporter permease subunit n=2 Tax=Streptacidiphilus alkalitolerans TaxID=3342712 RepID=A0ABV6WQ63_9ACTN
MTAPARPSTRTPERSRWAALVVLCSGLLMIILDGTVVTVALPAIQNDLGFSPAGLAWVMNAYLISFGGLLLLAGRLGDLLGRRRVFLAGLALFTLASLLCGLADDQVLLITARFVQGAGGALVSAVSLGMIVDLFTEPAELRRAFAGYSFVGSAGASLGLVLGGVLTQALNWHWIFFVNLPIGLAAALPALRLLPPDGPAAGVSRRSLDAVGALLVTAGLMLTVYTLVGTAQHGWTSARTLGTGALSLALLTGFVARQATAATPLLPLRMFRSRSVSGANLVQALMVAALFSFQVLLAQYLQHVLGYGAAATGLAMLPSALSIAVTSLGFAARLIARHGERRVLVGGLLMLVAGLAWLTRTPLHGHYPADVLPVTLLAAGFGLAITALTALGMSDATPADSGLVSGLFNTTQQIGAALGVAVTSTLAAARTSRLSAAGHSATNALNGGYHLAFAIATGLLLAATAVALTVLRGGGTAGAAAAPAAPEVARPVESPAQAPS